MFFEIWHIKREGQVMFFHPICNFLNTWQFCEVHKLWLGWHEARSFALVTFGQHVLCEM